FTHATFYSYSWYYWMANLPTSGSTGTWTGQFFLNGGQRGTLAFTYSAPACQTPAATGRTVNVSKGVAKDTLRGSDADSDLKAFRLVASPSHGEVRLSGPRGRYFSYIPESGYTGPDTWQFQDEDGQGTVSANGTMTMTVSPVLEHALRLEGGEDYVSVPSSSTLNVASFTLEAWIRRTAGSSGWQ